VMFRRSGTTPTTPDALEGSTRWSRTSNTRPSVKALQPASLGAHGTCRGRRACEGLSSVPRTEPVADVAEWVTRARSPRDARSDVRPTARLVPAASRPRTALRRQALPRSDCRCRPQERDPLVLRVAGSVSCAGSARRIARGSSRLGERTVDVAQACASAWASSGATVVPLVTSTHACGCRAVVRPRRRFGRRRPRARASSRFDVSRPFADLPGAGVAGGPALRAFASGRRSSCRERFRRWTWSVERPVDHDLV
jgi:hypothetical protein